MGGWIGGKGILPWPCSEDDEVARPLPGEDTNGVTVAEELPFEPTVARNVAEIDTRKPAEEAPAKLKKFGADELAELAAVKPTVVCSDKPMDVDAFVPEDEGIALKPAGEVSLDVEDAPSPSGSHKALGPASPSSLPSGEVASGSHKTVSASLKPKVNDARKNKVKLALPASCSKTPLPASGKGKEVAVVPKLSEASATKTEQKFYRSNYSIVSRTPRHNPKPRRPKNNRQKGIDLWGLDGNVRIPVKEIVQDDLVTEYNNVLLHLINMELGLNEMIQLCKPAHKKREKVLRLALKISLEDDAMIDLILRAFKSEKYFEVLASNLTHVFNWNRSVSRRIRQEVIRLGGRPINDPLSVSQR